MGKARHSTILGTLYVSPCSRAFLPAPADRARGSQGPIYDRRTFKRPVEVDSESSSDSEDSDAAERRRKAAKKRAAKADAKDAEELTFYRECRCFGGEDSAADLLLIFFLLLAPSLRIRTPFSALSRLLLPQSAQVAQVARKSTAS